MVINATVTVTIRVRTLQPGTILNVTVIVGAEAETNTANNRDDEPTLVRAPIPPPPAVLPDAHRLDEDADGREAWGYSGGGDSPRQARGHPSGSWCRAQGSCGSGLSDGRGIVSISVRSRARVGIVRLRIVGQPGTCATRRIGVVGIFKPPPVTG